MNRNNFFGMLSVVKLKKNKFVPHVIFQKQQEQQQQQQKN